jgi:hypothetical protein
MFSPSLMAMMLHVAATGHRALRRPRRHESVEAIAQDVGEAIERVMDSPLSRVALPVSGYSDQASPDMHQHATVGDLTQASGGRRRDVFGRVELGVLANWLGQRGGMYAESEFLDLGAPLQDAHAPGAGTTAANCAQLLGVRPATATPRIRVALIDRGDVAPGLSPDDFGGRVHHLNTSDIVFSQHALDVFETLLQRLSSHGLVDDVDIVCALVAPPARAVGPKCFEHANMVELQAAFNALATYAGTVARAPMPLVINLSMGAHAGPHLGSSPLEDSIARMLPFTGDNVLVCAAGNHGMLGLTAQRTLTPGDDEHFRLKTDASGCNELLVEFWWDEPGAGTLDATVRIHNARGMRFGVPFKIDASTAGMSMAVPAGGGFRSVVCESLYHARCLGTSHCLAFAMSATHSLDLAGLTIDVQMACGIHTTVDAWIVLPGDSRCAFVGGGPNRSLTVPATFADAVATAAVHPSGQSWIESSRGHPGLPGKPSLAHLVMPVSGAVPGTSFAAPRATADVVERFLRSAATTYNPLAVARFATVDDLVQEVLTKHGAAQAWNERTGYGRIVKGP